MRQLNRLHRLYALIIATACTTAIAAPASSAPVAPLGTSDVLSALGARSAYRLKNGQTLHVSPSENAVQAWLGKRGPFTLHAEGPGRFVSRNGEVELKFLADESGQPRDVRLFAPASWM